MKRSVLFICSGNICRSPIAEGIFRDLVARKSFAVEWNIESAGTHSFHAGNYADPRAVKACRTHDIDISDHKSRMIQNEDFYVFDYIVGMTEGHMTFLDRVRPGDAKSKCIKLLDLATNDKAKKLGDVPDPYWGEGLSVDNKFDYVYDLIESGIDGFWSIYGEK